MRLLLDTHIWLWSQSKPELLSRRVARVLKDSRNELWVSPISTWEIAMLCEKGRLRLDAPVSSWVERALAAAPLREAPVTHEIAIAAGQIALPHRDPADHLLAATAKIHGLTLVTSDRNLSSSEEFAVLVNR